MIEINTESDKPKENNITQGSDPVQTWRNYWSDEYAQYLYNNMFSVTSNLMAINTAMNRMASRGTYNPPTAQDFTQDINISPDIKDVSTIKQYLEQPAKHQKELRDISQYLENTIMQYERLTDYLGKTLTFKSDVRAVDYPKTSQDAETWRNGYDRCLGLLKKLNHRYQFELIMKKTMAEGGYFGWFEENDTFATFVEIPSDYCYITGRWDWGWTYAIDLTFYDKLIGLVNVTPELNNYYKKFILMRNQGLRGEKLRPYQYYPVPVEKGFVFTFNPLRAQIIPPMTGVFLDAVAILDYKNILKAKAGLDTLAAISMEIPVDKETGEPIMDAITAQKFIQTAVGVLPKQVAAFATPFKSEKMDFSGSSQTQNNWVGYGENEYWRTSGVGASIMDMTDTNAMAQKYSIMNDHGFVEHMYRQFENFVNLQFLLKSKTYKFKIHYYGNRYTDSEDMKDYAGLVSSVNAPMGKMFGLLGYNPEEVDAVIKQEDLLGWREVKAILPASQSSGADSGGRPSTSIDSKTDSGVNGVGYDSNQTSGK